MAKSIMWLAVLVLTPMVWGCGQHGSQNVQRLTGDDQTRLSSTGVVLIATPADGAYHSKVYPASGGKTVDVLERQFEKHAKRVEVVPDCRVLDCLRAAGASADAEYFVVPELLHWEDRIPMSDTPDRFEVRLTTYNRDGEVIDAAVFTSMSETRQFYGRPEDMLEDTLAPYIAALYD